jgi:hypothetical protein
MDYGNTAVAANKKAADSVDMVTQSLKDAIAAEDKLNAEMSHSVEYDLSTPGGIGFFLSNNTGAAIHATVEQIEQLIKAGYNLQQLIQNGVVTLPGTQSYANTSVQDLLNNKGAGGTASSTTTSHPVVTNGASPLATSSNSVNIQGGLAFNISNPDPRAVATEVSKVLMNTAFLGRQWPQASR